MLQEKAGEISGKIWEALSANGEMSSKDLKKAIKVRSDKDLYVALGWLLREDKIQTREEAKETFIVLK